MLALINKIISVSGRYKARIYIAFIFSFVKSVLSKMPIVLSFVAIRHFIEGTMTERVCIQLFAGLAVSVILEMIFQNIADRLQSAAGYLMFADLRNELGNHLRRMPMGYFTKGNIGKISAVLSSDMVFIEQNGMTQIANIMTDVFSQVIVLIFLSYLNIWIGLLTLLFVVIMSIVGRGMQKQSEINSDQRQLAAERLTDSVLEFVEGIGIIKTYNMLGERSRKLTKDFKFSCEANLEFEEKYTPWSRRIGIVYAIGTASILALSYYLYTVGVIPLANLVGILLFLFSMLASIRILYSETARLTVTSSCIDRMNELFAEVELEDAGKEHIDLSAVREDAMISFENVSFAYGDKEVIHNISFEAKKNTMTALVGPSGGGKSTLANLIARFWDVSSGAVVIGGKNVKDIPLNELMNNISMVFQRIYLFEDTIYNNIAMGRPDATREEVIEAARKARCYDFIMELPEGFDTVLSEGGASLSGGERQRISIARCILKDAPIVILDEATASVDVDNETYIQAAITELVKGKTLIVIAHRLNTIAGADNIIVIKNGQVDQEGRHDELIKVDGTYKSFVNSRTNMVGWSQVS